MRKLIVILSIVTVVIFGVVGICAYSGFSGYNNAIEQEKAIKGGNIIEAEYSRVFVRRVPGRGDNLIGYGLYYKFTYQGKTYEKRGYELLFSRYEEAKAESCIGQKVNVYVAESGASIIVGGEPYISGSITIFIVCVVIMTVWILIVAAIFIWLGYNRRKNRKNQETEQETEDVQNLSDK